MGLGREGWFLIITGHLKQFQLSSHTTSTCVDSKRELPNQIREAKTIELGHQYGDAEAFT